MSNNRDEILTIKQKVNVFFNIGRYDSAEKLIKSALIEYGPLANLYNLLGSTYHQQSKFADAIVQFKKAIECNINYIEAHVNLAATLADLSRYQEAEKTYEKALESTNKKNKQPIMLLGRIANCHSETGKLYENAGMFSEAILEYKKALELFSPLEDVQIRLGNIYLNQNNLEEAKKVFELTLNLAPDSVVARINLGITYFKLGKLDLARQHWEISYKNSPNNPISKAYFKIVENQLSI